MFEGLPEPKADAILALMAAFRADERENKLDLGVGIYKDAAGKTPVMRAIKTAEGQLLDTQETKAYVSPLGSAAFCSAMIAQVFGENADTGRIRAAQSVGGSGALRVLADLMKKGRPEADLWVSDPTWPNHIPLLTAAGYTLHTYPYYDSATGGVDFDAMISTLGKARAGDIVVLHGCCHNPTGADLTLDQWGKVIELLKTNDLFPFVDLAYQGFGDGLDEDAAAVRLMAEKLPEMVIAASCSKNLGLYRERVGAAILVAADEKQAARAHGQLGSVIRANYSMPPDHGANSTEIVLSDSTLNADWREELEAMRLRMVGLRQAFSEAMRKRSNSDRFDYIARQKGMFSRLPLDTAQLDKLRNEHGIYIVGDGRINVAGLPEDALDDLADAVCSVIAESE
ncbi:MAG: aromatic amino acid transaminase [Granulosicoccus sp.]